jgi:hypothetical protein
MVKITLVVDDQERFAVTTEAAAPPSHIYWIGLLAYGAVRLAMGHAAQASPIITPASARRGDFKGRA